MKEVKITAKTETSGKWCLIATGGMAQVLVDGHVTVGQYAKLSFTKAGYATSNVAAGAKASFRIFAESGTAGNLVRALFKKSNN